MSTRKKPTRSYAILKKCHNCQCYYLDGKEDCENTKCELYQFMPYRNKKPDLSWTEYNPKSKGLKTWDETKRDIKGDKDAFKN